MADHVEKTWHSFQTERVLEELSTDSQSGLSSEEAKRRASVYGPNSVKREKTRSGLYIFLLQFKNALIVILLAATAVSAALGELVDAVVISLIVVLAAGIGFVQEYRAETVFEALRKRLGANTTVVRDGLPLSLPSEDLVPGDIVLLDPGMRVPADVRLIQVASAQVDESSLTGESVPVLKSVEPVSEETQVPERSDMAFAGTTVTYGRARGVVVATGGATEFGKIVKETTEVEETDTPLDRQISSLGRGFGLLALGVISLVAASEVVRETMSSSLTVSSFVDVFLFGVALAVAAVPEALPAIVTGTEAVGMRVLARNNALVRKINAVETLGSTQVICFDKTGTLTRGEMMVKEAYAADQAFVVEGVGYAPEGSIRPAGGGSDTLPPPLVDLGRVAFLCNDATLRETPEGRWEVVGDPTEGALLALAGKIGFDPAGGRERESEIPFSSERKLMTTVHRSGEGGYEICVKGAPESVLTRCAWIEGRLGRTGFEEAERRTVTAICEQMSRRGLRLIALASRGFDSGKSWEPSIESDLTFLGVVGMEDPLREDAVEAVERAKRAGMRPVMVTGDHPSTAIAIAEKSGIFATGDGVLTGAELEKMTDEEVAERVPKTSVYARISPRDKLKIVGAWRGKGKVVAMTGDGVNDAPALRSADIGVAMGISGTDVAKEAADVVLVDDNFASLVRAVELGRWVYDNIRKALTYLLQSNLVEVAVLAFISLALAPLVGLSEGAMPLLPVQILYVNLATDGLPALALGFSPMDRDLLLRPPRASGESLFTGDVWRLLVANLLVQAPILIAGFDAALPGGIDAARTRLFLMFVFMEVSLAISYRSLSKSLLTTAPHRWLVASAAWEAFLILTLVQIPQAREALGIIIPGAQDAVWVVAGVILTTCACEVTKAVNRRSERSSRSGPAASQVGHRQ